MKKRMILLGITILIIIFVLGVYLYGTTDSFKAKAEESQTGYETLEKSSLPDTNPFDEANPFEYENPFSEEEE